MAEENNPWNSETELILNPVKLFAILISVGVFAIAIGTYFSSVLINLILPLVVMVYYSYTVYNDEKEILSIEQKADSVYYMGFIFTLVAMTASLIALANTNDLKFNLVVINFGLALTTTILGLVVRIMWLQLDSQNLSDAESRLKDKIIALTRMLGDETGNIVTKMTALSSEMEKASEGVKTNFEKLTESFDLSDKVNENLEGLNVSAELVNASFASVSSTVNQINPEFTRLNENIRTAIEIPVTLNHDLNAVAESSNRLINEFNNLSSSAVGLEPTILELNNRLSQSVTAVTNTIAALEEAMQRNSETVQTTRANLNESMAQSQEAIEANNQILRTNTGNLSQGAQQSRETLRLLHASLLETADSIREGNRVIQEALTESANLLEQQSEKPPEES